MIFLRRTGTRRKRTKVEPDHEPFVARSVLYVEMGSNLVENECSFNRWKSPPGEGDGH